MTAALQNLLATIRADLPARIHKCGVLLERALVLRLASPRGVRYLYLAPGAALRALAYGSDAPQMEYPHAAWLGPHLASTESTVLCCVEHIQGENVLRFAFANNTSLWVHFFGQSGNAVLTDPTHVILTAWHLREHHPAGAPYHRTPPPAPDLVISVLQPATLLQRLETLACDDLRRAVRHHLQSIRERLLRRLDKIQADAARATRAEEFRRYAALLRAYYHLITPYRDHVEVPDYEHPGATLTIPLDPRKSPQENLRWYCHQAEKWQRAPAAIEQRRQLTLTELAEVERQLAELPSVGARAALEAMLPRPAHHPPQRQTEAPRSRFRRFRSSDGFLIIAGRSARDNDELTCRIAKGHDIWMHTRNRPGAHVIIRANRNQSVPVRTLREAALVCAHLSKVPDGEVEEILYTLRKHVTKPKGAKQGTVMVAGGKTITVRERHAAMQAWMRTHAWDQPEAD